MTLRTGKHECLPGVGEGGREHEGHGDLRAGTAFWEVTLQGRTHDIRHVSTHTVHNTESHP